MLNRLCEPLAQAKEDAGQDLVCAALHQRLPRSFGDRRLQKRHSRPDVVVVRTDAGQDDECAGALGTRGELRNGLVEQRARTARVTRLEVVIRRLDCPAERFCDRVRRSQSTSCLEQFRGLARRPAGARQLAASSSAAATSPFGPLAASAR